MSCVLYIDTYVRPPQYISAVNKSQQTRQVIRTLEDHLNKQEQAYVKYKYIKHYNSTRQVQLNVLCLR
jgi:hypothetical protein